MAVIKDVLVHVDSTEAGRARLEYAFDLAACCGASLTGLHVLAPADVPPYFKPHAVERLFQDLEQRARRDAEASEALFAEVSASRSTRFRWRSVEGHMSERVCQEGRCADLIILGQYEAEGAPERRPLYLAEEVVLCAGRPILVIPEVLNHSFRCRRVLIGWDASREAARAVHDALPLLVQTKPAVQIIAVDETGPPAFPLELAEHLRRHGLAAKVRAVSPEASAGTELLQELDAGDFDLLVIGANSHPVWFQLVAGGATMSVLATATAPVLMSR